MSRDDDGLSSRWGPGGDIDSLATRELDRTQIATKPFLRRIYQEWYADIAASLSSGRGRVLEIGGGVGFFPCISQTS